MSGYLGFEPVEQEKDYYFVSYNSDDITRIQPLVKGIFDAGVPLWYDYALEYGKEWKKQIARKIKGSKTVLLFLTKGVIEKEKSFVREEYEMATEYLDKMVFVVLLDTIKNADVPIDSVPWWMEVMRNHVIDLTKVHDLDDQISEIGKALGIVNNNQHNDYPESKPIRYSEGLEFEELEDGTYCVSGIGTCEDMELVIPPATPEGVSVTVIWDYAFSDCDEIESVIIPNSITVIGRGAFSGCSALASVTIPNSVESIESGAFEWCEGLTSISIPSSVTDMGYAVFEKCTSLTSIVVDPHNPVLYSKNNCVITKEGENLLIGISTSQIPHGVASIEAYAFCECDSLIMVEIPRSVTRIGDFAFCDCENLMFVYMHWGVTSIGEFAFSGCSSLDSIGLPGSVVEIGKAAFSHCTCLSTIRLPNRVTIIEEETFSSCSTLTSVTIPNSVITIEKQAFAFCDRLSTVVIPNSTKMIETDAFIFSGICTIYCEHPSQPTEWAKDWIGSRTSVIWNYKPEAQ